MSFTRPTAVKAVPTLPSGDAIASYPTYADAQAAVAYLSEQRFAVQSLIIVGTNLQSVERVTGRMSYGRAAIAGAMSGAWFGLFVGLLMSMFGLQGAAPGVVFISVGIGAGFGLLFSVLSYAMSRGRRDFTSSSQIVAQQYAVLCEPGLAPEARRILAGSKVGLGRPVSPTASLPYGAPTHMISTTTTPTTQILAASQTDAALTGETGAQPAPRKIDPRWTTPDGRPRFGALAEDIPAEVVAADVVPAEAAARNQAEPVVVVEPPDAAIPVIPASSAAPQPDDFDPFAPPK